MTASAPTGLTFDVFKGVPAKVMVTALGATVAPNVVVDTPAAGDQGLPGGLALAVTGVLSGTPNGAASTNFGSSFAAGVTGEGQYKLTVKDTGNSITGIAVVINVHSDLPEEETDTTDQTPTADDNRENFYGQETGG